MKRFAMILFLMVVLCQFSTAGSLAAEISPDFEMEGQGNVREEMINDTGVSEGEIVVPAEGAIVFTEDVNEMENEVAEQDALENEPPEIAEESEEFDKNISGPTEDTSAWGTPNNEGEFLEHAIPAVGNSYNEQEGTDVMQSVDFGRTTVAISPDATDTKGIVILTNESGMWSVANGVFFAGPLPIILAVALLFLLLVAIIALAVGILFRIR